VLGPAGGCCSMRRRRSTGVVCAPPLPLPLPPAARITVSGCASRNRDSSSGWWIMNTDPEGGLSSDARDTCLLAGSSVSMGMVNPTIVAAFRDDELRADRLRGAAARCVTTRALVEQPLCAGLQADAMRDRQRVAMPRWRRKSACTSTTHADDPGECGCVTK